MRVRLTLCLVAWVLVCSGIRGADQEGVITLEEAIRHALAKNYSLTVESLGPQIRSAYITAEKGRFDPVVELRYFSSEDGDLLPTDPFTGARPAASLLTADSYELGFVGLTPWGMSYELGARSQNVRGTFNQFKDRYSTFGGITLTQPLLRNFGLGANLYRFRIAQLDQSRSVWDYRQSAIDLVTAVVLRYNDLLLARRVVETAVRSRDLAAELVGENERRFRVGSMSDYDVTLARSRAAQREEAILLARQNAEDVELRLKQLITNERSVQLLQSGPLTLEELPPAAETEIDTARDFQFAIAHRPDYQAALLLSKRAELDRRFSSNQRLPRVDVVASLGYSGLDERFDESRRQVEDRENRSYRAGVVVGIPLTFAQERGRLRAARLQALQARYQMEAVEQSILVDVGNAARNVRVTRERVATTRVARELAQKTLEAELKRLRTATGNGSTYFVLELQQSLAQIEVREFQALCDARKAVAEHHRILGRTLEFHRIVLE